MYHTVCAVYIIDKLYSNKRQCSSLKHLSWVEIEPATFGLAVTASNHSIGQINTIVNINVRLYRETYLCQGYSKRYT